MNVPNIGRISLFLLLTFFLATPQLVQAQLEEQPTTEQEVVEIADPALIQAATETYFTAVEDYRTKEDQYVISREQYYQLNTLAAQDEAIRRGKEVLRARAQVLQAYLQYLQLLLDQTRGIEIQDKQAAAAGLQQKSLELVTYLDQVAALQTREQIDAHFLRLNGQQDSIENAAYSSLVLIKIGEIQTAIDTARAVRQKVSAEVQGSSTISAADKAIAERGLEEVDRLLQRASNNNVTLISDYRRDTAQAQYNESRYRTFQNNADFSYLQLRQVSNFLKEIIKNV